MMKLKILLLFLLAAFTATAQKKTVSLLLPGKGKIDVEQLKNGPNLKQDISRLSVSELRVLRNSIAARQGYCFMDAELRELFYNTTWYYDTLENRCYYSGADWNAVVYTPEEQSFVNKLKAREDELLKTNFTDKGVNVANLVNPYQVMEMPAPLATQLGRNGFAIVPSDYEQLFHVYEKNDYCDFPNFVTTDLYLQAFHLYVNALTRKLEQRSLYGQVNQLCKELAFKLKEKAAKATSAKYREAALRSAAYFDVAVALLTGAKPDNLTAQYAAQIKQEVANVMAAATTVPSLIPTKGNVFVYDTFRPRGHYTRSDTLQRYFRGMMWLQSVPFIMDDEQILLQAMVIAEAMEEKGNAPANFYDNMMHEYRDIDKTIQFLMGHPDNVAISDLAALVKTYGSRVEQLADNADAMRDISARMVELSKQRTRIGPKQPSYSPYRLNFMPQRYHPDAEVMLEMVDYKSQPTQRDVPSGLDIFAAMGNEGAQSILTGETEATKWQGFQPTLQKMRQLMDTVKTDCSLATMWLKSLSYAADHEAKIKANYPYFMQNADWQRKELNTALSSWAELKHDAILYAKQPMGAECGAGGPPEPIVKGYVEPNVAFYAEAERMLTEAADKLRSELLDADMAEATYKMRDMAKFLHTISLKELVGEPLTESDYNAIEVIGANFENLSLDLIREPNSYIDEWNDVQGTDRNVALVADVYTASADNNPNKSVLYAAVGQADEIYVVVEIGGYLYLTRGAVLSFREFKQPLDAPRLTDEEWQHKVKAQPRYGVPEWMKPITVPLKKPITENDEIFFSSGC